MFCEKCGSRIPENSKFCENCGAPVPAAGPGGGNAGDAGNAYGPAASGGTIREEGNVQEGQAQETQEPEGQQITENIYLCPDGMYRWIYEYDMVRNPVILFTVWKVMGIAFLAVFLFLQVITLISGDGLFLPGWDNGGKYAFFCLVLLFGPVAILSYFIVAASYGWRYMVLFEMNDAGVKFIQMPGQFKKAQALGWLSAMAGLVTGNLAAAGAGVLAASRDSMYSEFAKVRAVIPKRGFHTIKVNGRLMHNQVYAEDADFDFVLNYIQQRTPQAKHG